MPNQVALISLDMLLKLLQNHEVKSLTGSVRPYQAFQLLTLETYGLVMTVVDTRTI